MPKFWPLLGSVLFFLIAPVTVAVLVPAWIAENHAPTPFLATLAFRVVGLLLAAAGAVPLVDSFGRFVIDGSGTPAPIAPTQRLVVSGFYRYVRNPMYVGVALIILGDALVLADPRVFLYAAFVCLAFHMFVLAYEEPTLRGRYGAEYETFCTNVPRWLPRLTPWQPAS